MINKQLILSKLAPFQNNKKVIVEKQSIGDIMNGLLKAHNFYSSEYDKIYKYFIGKNIEQTCQNIFDFLKENVPYYIEKNSQYISSPSSILCKKPGSDCKSFSLFANGIMDAYKRNENKNFEVIYRFAGYDGKKNVGHVFSVIKTTGEKYFWIDPVLSIFDERNVTPTYFIDKKIKPMSLISINGINNVQLPNAYPAFCSVGKRYESVGSIRVGGSDDDEDFDLMKTLSFLQSISLADIINFFKDWNISDGEKMKRGFYEKGLTPDQMLMWYIVNKADDWAFLHQAKEILIWDTPNISYNVADAFNTLIDKPQWKQINQQYDVAFDLSKTNKKNVVALPKQYQGKNYVTPTGGGGGNPGGGGGGEIPQQKKSPLLPLGLGFLLLKMLS